jgi:hypothetical protein
MNNIIKSILLITIALFFSSTTCEVKEDDDICLKKETLIEGTFVLSALVKYKDNVPYNGEINFKINKIYCDGTIKGIYTREGSTDEGGYYSTGYIYTYKYENLHDRVEFYFQVGDPVNRKWFKYYYEDIKKEDAYTVNEAFTVTLDWDSPGK